jgi:hypothetical protein
MTNLPPIPPHMFKLPRFRIMGMDAPVPWFVAWFKDGERCRPGEGEPDFRVVDTEKFRRAVKEKLCWVCGEKLGQYMAFVIGPMCVVNRVTSEPPNHHDCALFSAQACPFLTRPNMRRNKKELPEQIVDPAGHFIERNPGAICVYITKSYKPFRAHAGGDGVLIKLGEPTGVNWFAEGRTATRAQVTASIESGYPALFKMAQQDGPDAIAELERERMAAEALLPVDKELLQA